MIIHCWVFLYVFVLLCCLMLESSHKDQHKTGQRLLSKVALRLHRSFWNVTFRQHDYITVEKNQIFLAVSADFPMPSANRHPHRIFYLFFLCWCLKALEACKLLYIYSPPPPPLTQLVWSLFIEHIHISQTYFKSKLSQTLEAPYPNMAFRRVYFVHQFA